MEIKVERWVTFHNQDGQWDITIHRSYVASDAKYYRLRVAVPLELLGSEVIAEVEGTTK